MKKLVFLLFAVIFASLFVVSAQQVPAAPDFPICNFEGKIIQMEHVDAYTEDNPAALCYGRNFPAYYLIDLNLSKISTKTAGVKYCENLYKLGETKKIIVYDSLFKQAPEVGKEISGILQFSGDECLGGNIVQSIKEPNFLVKFWNWLTSLFSGLF